MLGRKGHTGFRGGVMIRIRYGTSSTATAEPQNMLLKMGGMLCAKAVATSVLVVRVTYAFHQLLIPLTDLNPPLQLDRINSIRSLVCISGPADRLLNFDPITSSPPALTVQHHPCANLNLHNPKTHLVIRLGPLYRPRSISRRREPIPAHNTIRRIRHHLPLAPFPYPLACRIVKVQRTI